MEAYQILYLPTGEYVNSKNRANDSVLFSDMSSAQAMACGIVSHTAYIAGAPLSDYSVGIVSATNKFYIEEFEYISVPVSSVYPIPKVLTLA